MIVLHPHTRYTITWCRDPIRSAGRPAWRALPGRGMERAGTPGTTGSSEAERLRRWAGGRARSDDRPRACKHTSSTYVKYMAAQDFCTYRPTHIHTHIQSAHTAAARWLSHSCGRTGRFGKQARRMQERSQRRAPGLGSSSFNSYNPRRGPLAAPRSPPLARTPQRARKRSYVAGDSHAVAPYVATSRQQGNASAR